FFKNTDFIITALKSLPTLLLPLGFASSNNILGLLLLSILMIVGLDFTTHHNEFLELLFRVCVHVAGPVRDHRLLKIVRNLVAFIGHICVFYMIGRIIVDYPSLIIPRTFPIKRALLSNYHHGGAYTVFVMWICQTPRRLTTSVDRSLTTVPYAFSTYVLYTWNCFNINKRQLELHFRVRIFFYIAPRFIVLVRLHSCDVTIISYVILVSKYVTAYFQLYFQVTDVEAQLVSKLHNSLR
ncbi:hypothetical protein L9F63_003187, partial [Diploptera punctata]